MSRAEKGFGRIMEEVEVFGAARQWPRNRFGDPVSGNYRACTASFNMPVDSGTARS